MGGLWAEFRRGMRRGKPPRLPSGLTYCPGCDEPRGRARFADKASGGNIELDISCICDGVLCRWCGRVPVRRPASNRFDPESRQVRHSGTWASEAPCARCRADGAGMAPHDSGTARYDIGATPFYGEVSASTDYFDNRRYRTFEAGLSELAARHGLVLLNVRRMQGIWRFHHEPSALISVDGDTDSVLAVMADLADRWGQDAVLCFSADLAGGSRLHLGSTRCSVEEICVLLADDDLSGVAVDADGAVMIVDPRGDQSDRARALLQRLGAFDDDVEGHGFLHVRD